jgi:hypothetical protein
MTRAFVAVGNPEFVTMMLESRDFEAIPITSDSVIDNINSLESSHFVVVDSTSPPWVLREINDRHLLSVAYETLPSDFEVTAFAESNLKFIDLLIILKDVAGALVPVTEEFARKLATIKVLYQSHALSS